MNVWKKQTVQYFKNGKRVTKNTKGSKPKKIFSKRFYGTLKTSSRKRKQVPLTENEKTSERLLAKLQADHLNGGTASTTRYGKPDRPPCANAGDDRRAFSVSSGHLKSFQRSHLNLCTVDAAKAL